MKKLTITIIATVISTGAYAGCLKNAQELVASQRGYSLINNESIILKAGTDTLAYGAEVFNSNNVDAEVFFTQKPGSVSIKYGALLFNKNNCKFLNYQALGDNL